MSLPRLDGLKVREAARHFEVDCLDCSVYTYGGQDIYELALEHAREEPGHRVQIAEKRLSFVEADRV